MKKYPFYIDGEGYHVFVPADGIKRSFSVTDSDKAGRSVAAGAPMIRDILGTFINYTITIDPSRTSKAEYDRLFLKLMEPVDSHTVKVPFGQGWLTYQAYVTQGEDTIKTMAGGNRYKGLSVNCIAMKAQWVPGGSLKGYSES